MATTDNDAKTPTISKKWLYGSLAVIALALGLFLDKDAVAVEANPIDQSVEQLKVTNEDSVKIDTDTENFESYEDDFTEDDEE